jgi:hypothetical protein
MVPGIFCLVDTTGKTPLRLPSGRFFSFFLQVGKTGVDSLGRFHYLPARSLSEGRAKHRRPFEERTVRDEAGQGCRDRDVIH